MKVIAVNGGPRKNGSTKTLLDAALRGAEDKGFETKLVNLYDIDFKGCRSCFACKVKDSPYYGRCMYQDDLKPLLDEIHDEADVLLLGSPIYWWDVTGETRAFVERVFFPLLNYGKDEKQLLGREIPVGGIYSMNVTQDLAEKFGYPKTLDNIGRFFRDYVGPYEALMSCDNPVFFKYQHYVADSFDQAHKDEVRRTQFPIDCANAYAMGKRLAATAEKL